MKRDDAWYNLFLQQCRVGNLPMEDCSYFHGVLTLTSPCAFKCGCIDDVVEVAILGPDRRTWKERFLRGSADMAALQKFPEGESAECRGKWAWRHRVLTVADSLAPEGSQEPLQQRASLVHLQRDQLLCDEPARESRTSS